MRVPFSSVLKSSSFEIEWVVEQSSEDWCVKLITRSAKISNSR